MRCSVCIYAFFYVFTVTVVKFTVFVKGLAVYVYFPADTATVFALVGYALKIFVVFGRVQFYGFSPPYFLLYYKINVLVL